VSRILLLLFVVLYALRTVAGQPTWAEGKDIPDGSFPGPPLSAIAGPVFIATLYPVVQLDKSLVEIMPVIEDAYNFWGKELISSHSIQTYFPVPLSYPYRFSDAGLHLLQDRLKKIALIDPDSIQLNTLPTIPKKWHHEYRQEDLRALLIEEPYIHFTVKGRDKMAFMKFPTFVAVLFDYARHPVRSYADYQALARYWRDKIGLLGQHEELREVLGISRKTREWASIPILTFVASPAYHDASFQNRYVFGSVPWPEKSQLFCERSLSGALPPRQDGVIAVHPSRAARISSMRGIRLPYGGCTTATSHSCMRVRTGPSEE
jgi:hypothetical protein